MWASKVHYLFNMVVNLTTCQIRMLSWIVIFKVHFQSTVDFKNFIPFTAGTHGQITHQSPVTLWMPIRLKSTACPSIPTVSLFSPPARQTRSVQFVKNTLSHVTNVNNAHAYASMCVFITVDCCIVGSAQPEAEASFIWIPQGWNLPGNTFFLQISSFQHFNDNKKFCCKS